MCTNDWLQQFGATKVYHLNSCTFDHIPLWIVPSGIDPPPISKPFRFEEMWLANKGCGHMVEAVWRGQFPCDAEVEVIKKVESEEWS